jgi:hypothetical protein
MSFERAQYEYDMQEPEEHEFECDACGAGCDGHWKQCECGQDPDCENCGGTGWDQEVVPLCEKCLMEIAKEEMAEDERNG